MTTRRLCAAVFAFLTFLFSIGTSTGGAEPAVRSESELEDVLITNPEDASAWLLLADTLRKDHKRVPALLCTVRFLTLETESPRSKVAASQLWGLLFEGVTPGDPNSPGVRAPGGRDDPWWDLELLVSTVAFLRHRGQGSQMNDAQFFASAMEGVTIFLEGHLHLEEVTPFWQTLVIPYFLDARNKKHVEAMGYDIRRSLAEDDITSWLKDHESEVVSFREWSRRWRRGG